MQSLSDLGPKQKDFNNQPAMGFKTRQSFNQDYKLLSKAVLQQLHWIKNIKFSMCNTGDLIDALDMNTESKLGRWNFVVIIGIPKAFLRQSLKR